MGALLVSGFVFRSLVKSVYVHMHVKCNVVIAARRPALCDIGPHVKSLGVR